MVHSASSTLTSHERNTVLFQEPHVAFLPGVLKRTLMLDRVFKAAGNRIKRLLHPLPVQLRSSASGLVPTWFLPIITDLELRYMNRMYDSGSEFLNSLGECERANNSECQIRLLVLTQQP